MRLDKFLCEMNQGTRSQVKDLIRKKQVSVNGTIVTKPETQIQENTDRIVLQGREICYQKYVYYMLNKPRGFVSATTDSRERTVLDLLGEQKANDLFPVGRLDKDTEGLLLMTNDGPLAHHLLSPHHHVEKEYYVEHKLPLTDEDIYSIETGITFQSVTYRPARYEKISDTSCHLTIREGKYHEIKMIFESLGDKVVYLKRLRMKNLRLGDNLKPGEYHPLTAEEIADLKEGMPQ